MSELTLIKGVGPVTAEKLTAGGVEDVDAVAEAALELLVQLTGFYETRAAAIREAARELSVDVPNGSENIVAPPPGEAAKPPGKKSAKKARKRARKLEKLAARLRKSANKAKKAGKLKRAKKAKKAARKAERKAKKAKKRASS